MHYVVGDIHNNSRKLRALLQKISFGEEDHLICLGDIFDRSDVEAAPVETYFTVSGLGDNCMVVRGNHDEWLADYILRYYAAPERKRKKMPPYRYNSFKLLKSRLTDMDMQNLASDIKTWPLQKELVLGDKRYLFAHAQTAEPSSKQDRGFYLMGDVNSYENFLADGVPGFISFCGHMDTERMYMEKGVFCSEVRPSIWRNEIGNVYMMDCRCGFSSGKLACFCLETGKCFYV